MLRMRIRRRLYRRAEALIGALGLVEARPVSVSNHTSFRTAAPPEVRPTPPAPPASTSPSSTASTSPETLTAEAVQHLLDDMVRPGLQMDGGDITLIKVDQGDVYVELVGACSSCPSSVMTMKLGVERLLEEELPGFRSLIEVTPSSAAPPA